MLDLGEMLRKGMIEGILQAIMIVMPYIISLITSVIVMGLIKKITYKLLLVSGDSEKMAKKKVQGMTDVVDIVSTLKDISDCS